MHLGGGCSIIGINHTRTSTKTTIYGQNWDAHPDQRDTIIFVIAHQKERPSIAWMGEAGLICRMAGMNSAGIGLGGNTLSVTRPLTLADCLFNLLTGILWIRIISLTRWRLPP